MVGSDDRIWFCFQKVHCQLICGSVGNLFDYLDSQDVVTFTGSAGTGRKLKNHQKIIEKAIRFNMEADSLNCIILGPDVTVEMDEFTIFIKEVVREMTAKAGQNVLRSVARLFRRGGLSP